jgi:hypothetical protein
VFCERDVQVLLLVAQLSKDGMGQKGVARRLKQVADDGWQELPEVPAEWWDTVSHILVPAASFIKVGRPQETELERVYEEPEERARAPESDWGEIQELTQRLVNLQQTLTQKENDLAAKDDLIAQQRKSLQIAQVALQLTAEQQAIHAKATMHRRRAARSVLVILSMIAVVVLLIVFLH